MNATAGTGGGMGGHDLLVYEILARSRMHEAEEAARHARLVHQLVAGRRWERLARFADRRVEHIRCLL